MNRLNAVVLALAMFASGATLAESEFAVYGGFQSSPHSRVTPAEGDSFLAAWKGDSMSFPIYLGLRYTEWLDDEWGWAVNYTHTKAKADADTLTTNNYQTLEFTDGANPLTLVALRRFAPMNGGIKPYVGVGAGISVPHVEEQRTGAYANKQTFEYQYGGPVLTALAGFKYPLNERWDLLTEFQMHYMMLDVKVAKADGSSGRLKTNLVTNALSIGASYRF
jgi:lipid A oxidase